MNSTIGVSDSLRTAACILFYVENFNQVSPLLQCRWFFSKLWGVVMCGTSTPAMALPDSKWSISSIVDANNLSVNIRDTKTRKRRAFKFLMHPSTSVLFTYKTYRLVICLDISRSIYYVRSDGSMAVDDMMKSLFAMLTRIHKSLKSQLHISSVYISVIAHHSEVNLSYSMWQCEMRKMSNLDQIFQSLKRCGEAVEDLTFQRVVNPDMYTEAHQCKYSRSGDEMSMSSIIEGILYHSNLLPRSACPIAVLITPGIMDVPVSQISKVLAMEHLALHVLVINLCEDGYPLGCIPEVDNLRVVAEATGGSLEVLPSSFATDLDSLGQIFIRPFYARREDTFISTDPSLRLKESRLHGYQLEGATLEHILAARLSEGFNMTNISLESVNRSKGTLPQYQKSSLTSFVTIRLEKRYNQVSSLVYFVSFRTNSPDHGHSEELWSISSPDHQQKKTSHVYTKGSLSIDIIWISPDRVVPSTASDGSGGLGIVTEVRVMSENDKNMAGLLGLYGMPGYGYSVPPTHTPNSKTSKSSAASTYKYAAVLQQLAASADLVEDICRLNCVCKTTLYLRAFFVLTTITSNAKCRSTIFSSIKETLPTAKFSQLDTLKWLCVVPLMTGEDHDASAESSGAELYEVLVIEVRQSVSVFIEVSISLLGNGSGANVIDVKSISDAVHTALCALAFDPLLLRRDLSLIASSNPQSGKSQHFALCHLQSKSHFLSMDLTQRFLMESLVSEVCRNKIALGFQVATCVGEEQVELCLCAVIAACPSGIASDSLLQCKVECSEEGVMTTYSWEPTSQVRSFRKVQDVSSDHDFRSSGEVLVSMADGSLAGVGTMPLPLKLTTENCASLLVSLVEMLMEQNLRTYEFYDALTCIYPKGVTCQQLQVGALGMSRQVPPLRISSQKWKCLKSYSYQRKIYVPSFSEGYYSIRCQAESGDRGSDSNVGFGIEITGLDKPEIARSLVHLLKESLARVLQLVEFEVQVPLTEVGANDGKKLVTFCQPVPEGLIVIEVDPQDENFVITPARRISSEHICPEASSFEAENYDDYDDLISPDHNYYSIEEKSDLVTGQHDANYVGTNEAILIDEVVGTPSHRSFSATDGDISSAKLRIDFHFLSIPMNTLFGNTELTEMAQSCIVDTNISKLKDKNQAHTKRGLAQAAKNKLLEMNEAILKFHRCNFALVLYSGLRNGSISRVDRSDLAMALSHCSTDSAELDLTNLCAIKRTVFEGKSLATSTEDMLPLPELFQYTIGKYLTPIADSSSFLFTPPPNVFNLPKHDNIYSMAVFVNIYVIRKTLGPDATVEVVPDTFQVGNDSNGLSAALFDIYSKRNDEMLDDNITIRVECLTSSIAGTEDDFKKSTSLDQCEAPWTQKSERERAVSDLQSAIGTPGAFTIGPGVHDFYHASVMRRLTSELESLITYDTLYSLLLMPVVTKGTIVLVQHSLRSIKGLIEKVHSMDFVVPASCHVPSFSDVINGYFDQELQQCPMFNQIGDIYYARGWTLEEEEDVKTEREDGEITVSVVTSKRTVPCWILLTVANITTRAEKTIEENMSIMTLDVSLILRMVGEYSEEEVKIHRQIQDILDNCCHKVNQRILLNDLNQSRVASVLLIKSAATSAAAPAAPVFSSRRQGRLSSGQNKAKEESVPIFEFPTEPPIKPSSSSWKSFVPGCFECPKQGHIELVLPGDVSTVLSTTALSHANVVSSLESMVLHFFLISNLKKCFVYQDAGADVYYMSFAPYVDEKDLKIFLTVFGLSPPSAAVKGALKKTLEVKLTELIANVISLTIIPRRAVLPMNHLQFLKSCGLSKRVDFAFKLPKYVSDPYFFCVLAKQIFNKSEAFITLTLQYVDKTQTSFSSIIHPASFGYDIREAEHTKKEEPDTMNHAGIFRPNLERKTHVMEEHTDSATLSPVFFFRNKKKLTPRAKARCDASLVQWQQGDFTILYSPSTSGGGGGAADKDKSSMSSKRREKGGGGIKRNFTQASGLALIEFEPVRLPFEASAVPESVPDAAGVDEKISFPNIIPTGSVESLMADVELLLSHIKDGKSIELEAVPNIMTVETEDQCDCSHSSRFKTEYTFLSVRIFPTRAINRSTLAEAFGHCFNQALVMYCIERLYTAYQNRQCAAPVRTMLKKRSDRRLSLDGPDDLLSGSSSPSFEADGIVTAEINGADILRACHDIIMMNLSHDQHSMSCTHVVQVPLSLPKKAARELFRSMTDCINETIPGMRKHLVLPDGGALYSTADAQLQGGSVKWLDVSNDGSVGSCSAIIGEHFDSGEDESFVWQGGKDGQLMMMPEREWLDGVRWVRDSHPDNSLICPLWLRKRRYSIEVTTCPSGVYVFFFNIERALVDKLKDKIIDITLSALRLVQASQVLLLEKTGLKRIVNPVIHPTSDEKWEHGLTLDKLHVLQLQISNLFWSQHVLSRLYMFPTPEVYSSVSVPVILPHHVNELWEIPLFVWEEGVFISASCIPLPACRSRVAALFTSATDGISHIPEGKMRSGSLNPNAYEQPVMSDDMTDYVDILRHLMATVDYSFIGSSVDKNIFIVLPIPRTASLYVVQINTSIPDSLVVTRRMADCQEIISSLSIYFNLENSEWLLSAVSAACLAEPCLGTSSEKEISACGHYGETQSVVDAITNHPNVIKLNSSLYCASLGALFFCCATRTASGGDSGSPTEGRRVLDALYTAESVLHEDCVLIEQVFSLADLIGDEDTAYGLVRPTPEDIIKTFAGGALSERACTLSYSPESAMAVLRFVATSRRTNCVLNYSQSACGTTTMPRIASRGRWMDTPVDLASRTQRNIYGLLSDSVLGMSVLRRDPGNDEQISLTTLLFPGSRVIGTEKDLLSNPELEGRIAEEMGRFRYVPSGSVQQIATNIEMDILTACKSAIANTYRDRGWSVLYGESSPFRQQQLNDGKFMGAIFKYSSRIKLVCLDFLIPSLNRLLSPKHCRIFKKICQHALGARFFYFSSSSRDEIIEHYIIIGEAGRYPKSNRHFVHVKASPEAGSSIEFVEIEATTCSDEEIIGTQQQLVETVVNIVLYGTSMLCEDDKSSFGSFV